MVQASESSTRERIRDAAIAAFAERGFDGASLRDIAGVAGVSAALIVHHFGSKDGLRAACDEHVTHTLVTNKRELAGSGAATMMQRALADRERSLPLVDYLARMLTADSAAADDLFDALLAATRDLLSQQAQAGMLRPQSDEDVTAVALTMYTMAPILLRRQLSRTLGEDDFSEALLRRLTLPLLELYTHGLYADERLLTAARDTFDPPTGT